MAGKFLEMKEAAERLGISPDELNELRENGEAHGYRDGASWKFKIEEVERLIAERGVSGSEPAGDDAASMPLDDLDDLLAPIDEAGDDDAESILVSEEELGHSSEGTSSTVIGKKDKGKSADSDLALKFEDDDEDLVLSDDESGQEVPLKSPGESDLVLDDDDLMMEGSSAGSALDLADVDDDDLVLGGSGVGSDVTLGSGDSGINLSSPADSGLSLEEEPLELGGSAIESLVLPEDDEDAIMLEEESADPDAATQLKADDEFLLTPVEDDGGEDDSSGSQVIALEDSADFDENADTLLGDPTLQPMLVPDEGADMGAMAEVAPVDPAAVAGVPGMAPAGQAQVAAMGVAPASLGADLPEASYSVWNVLGLLMALMFMVVCGLFMFDVVRSLTAYQEGAVTTTSLMDGLLKAFKLTP